MCDATRSMLFIATGTGLTALLGCALYPFQPAATLTAAGLVTVGMARRDRRPRVLLGIERDKVLSDVAGTTPGKVTPSLGLLARIVGYVIVPLGGLIGSRLQDPGRHRIAQKLDQRAESLKTGGTIEELSLGDRRPAARVRGDGRQRAHRTAGQQHPDQGADVLYEDLGTGVSWKGKQLNLTAKVRCVQPQSAPLVNVAVWQTNPTGTMNGRINEQVSQVNGVFDENGFADINVLVTFD